MLPRAARPAPAPEPAAAPPDHTASAPPPSAEAASDPEPHLPWFDRPREAGAAPEPVVAPDPPALSAGPVDLDAPRATEEPHRDQAREPEDDLFDRRDPPAPHAPAEPADEAWPHRVSAPHADEGVSPHQPDRVPEWAWPSALDRASEPAVPREESRAPEPLAAAEPLRPRRERPSPAAPAGRPLDPDAARTLGNIRRLMLVSNLFMVVAIGAVLVVVGYRLFRTEPAPPPPPPTPKPALAAIPNDMTLTLPRGARIVQTAVAGDRLVITLQIDGAAEIRTFDIKTLKPTGRMSFATAP